jgi:hypothetical protein
MPERDPHGPDDALAGQWSGFDSDLDQTVGGVATVPSVLARPKITFRTWVNEWQADAQALDVEESWFMLTSTCCRVSATKQRRES